MADTLYRGQILYTDQQLTSNNGSYYAKMQSDGNFVIYTSSGVAIWNTGTWTQGPSAIVLQGDQNLVIYRNTGGPATWNSGTVGSGAYRLTMQDDGNLVLYTSTNVAVWETGTAYGSLTNQGVLVVNNNNQVLISSDTRNLHFVGKGSFIGYNRAFNEAGGLRQMVFRVYSSVTPVPFFTMPTGDFYGISAVRNVGGTAWDIEISRSGANDVICECYCFADPRAVTATETHGMVVYRDDGTPSFDSRLRPLAVTGGGTVYPNGSVIWHGVWGSARFCSSGAIMWPDAYNSFYVPGTGKQIYHYAANAQAEREWDYSEERKACTGFNAYGSCIGYGTVEQWWSRYWGFYRSGIRRNGGNIDCGWVTHAFGCIYQYNKGASFIGINLGGGGAAGGYWPYSNDTLNLQGFPVILADGSRYD